MNESFDDQDTEFTYEIPDCLMDGDYIEIHGVCHGKRIVFELLTEEASTQNIFDKLPLQIILTTDGLVTVISRNPEKVAKQERSVENGIQIDKAFELCVHAYKKCYVVKLNGEDVCGQDHLVPLNEAFALSMQGKVDILSLEFKDMYYDEEEMNNNTNMSSANNNSNSIRMDDAQAGFVRVNELRQSSIRRNDPPVMVPTRTGSKLEKQSIKSKDSNLEVTAWKTSNDLSRAYLDVDYKVSTLDRNSAAHSYRNSIDFSHNSDSRISGTLPPLGKSANDRVSDYVMGSRGNLNTNDASHIKPKTSIFGSRKSATLSNSKIEQRFNEGRSQTDAGDLHHGSYSVLDDEDHIGSQLSATTSTPNLQDKHKKKRFSLLGKNRKSTGSESDVRNDSKKSKGSTPDIRLKDGEGEKKKKGLHLKNPFKRSKTKGTVNQTPSVSSDLAFTRNTIHPAINVAVTERLPKEMSKKPAPEIAAYLHKSNPSAEFDTLNLTGREILSEDTHFAPFDRKHYDGYENVGSSYDPFKHKTLSDSRKSIEISSLSDLHSQGKLKGPAPELAALIHSKHPTLNPEDITIAQASGSHIRPFTPTDHSPKQSRYHNEPPSDIANLKLKGTAPEIAAIINSRTKSPNHEDITLTQRCDQNFHPYPTVDTSGKKPFKPSGSASEIAADIHKNNLADHRPYADYTLTGTNTNEIQGTKYVLKEKVQSTRKALSLSEHISDGDETESGGSEVYTDNECYLEVGKSEYYFDRKRSLRNYRSKRSTKLEREARRNMGLHRNDSQESVSSSISSLKPTDRKLTPKYRKRPGTKKEEVSSWLNSSNSRKESIKCDSSMDLPHPLTIGRSALVYGHFKYNSAARQSCLLKLEFNTFYEEANECETLYLQLWSDGGLDILNSQSINSKILYSSSNDIQYLTLKNNEFCNNDKQQITSNDLFTLILNNQFLKSINYHLKSFKLEDSTNAELDKLFMPRNLCLPLILHMKDESRQTNTLNLLTKLTADTKRVIIEYVYKPISSSEFVSMQILLNFETSNLIIQEIAKETNNIQYAEKEITYIPEQICKMKFSWYNNTLKVLLNSDESMMYNFEQYYPLQFLSHIRINGDFMLLNAELQSDE
uniref:Galectin domain-containing protein n=1 Tax=Schistosoma haematobium TaxID=6185 RepID=A0A095A3I9_SCHHA